MWLQHITIANAVCKLGTVAQEMNRIQGIYERPINPLTARVV